jgi:hypothetical protein
MQKKNIGKFRKDYNTHTHTVGSVERSDTVHGSKSTSEEEQEAGTLSVPIHEFALLFSECERFLCFTFQIKIVTSYCVPR